MVSFALILANAILAQVTEQVKITGTVTDLTDGTRLPGVNISIKGTQTGGVTDNDGKYSITVPKGSVLMYTMIGYETQEILIENQVLINVRLQAVSTPLDEVVVIGYGTTTKKEITGSIATVKPEDFNRGAYNNPIVLAQGKVAGLNIVKPDGADPQAGYDIILRGTNTLTSGQGPLIIVDGIAGVDLKNVSPDEIESMDVLKDGSAAAIYGTRGSNGVIIITTKRARSGQAKVEYAGKLSIQAGPRMVENLSAGEFREAIYTYAPDKVVNIYDDNVDWFDEVTRSVPFSQQHNLAISGGTDLFSHRTMFFVDLADGLLKGNQANKYLVRTNVNQKVLGDLLLLDYNLVYGMRKYTPANYDIFYQAFIRNPTSPVYDSTNTTYGGYTYLPGVDYYNPVAMLNERIREGKTNDFSGNVRATLRLAKSLNWSNLFSADLSDWEEISYMTKYYPSRVGRNGVAEIDNGRFSNMQYESTLNYSTSFGESSLQALLGYNYQKLQFNNSYMVNSGFDSDYYTVNNIGAGSSLAGGTAEMGSYKSMSELVSFFGRVVYNYDDRYLASASLRREGSSRFGANNKWGWFPAVSFGWRMNREGFMSDVAWVNDLKLRIGYGVTGNQEFENYQSLTLMGRAGKFYYDGEWMNTYQPVSNPNPDLRWEKKQEVNLGFDYAFLDNRLFGALDLYYRQSSDLLYTYTVSVPPYLIDELYTNVGTVSNKGIELTLGAMPIKKENFAWTTTLTYSTNINKLVKFSNAEFTNKYVEIGWLGGAFPLNCQRLEEGKPIGTFYGPVWLGLDETGHDKFKNQDPVGRVSPDKWEDIGNANPFCMLGWTNNLTYGNWNLNFALRAQIGGKVLNMYRLYYENWQSIGRNIVHTQLETPEFIGNGQYSSKYVENASFLKLDNITLGYRFKPFKKYVTGLQVYMTAQNVFTLTGYQGLDPEVNIGGLAPGIEYLYYYPRTTMITLGVNVSL
jgi:TonB-linked SusC/RagA family outer membrane protein